MSPARQRAILAVLHRAPDEVDPDLLVELVRDGSLRLRVTTAGLSQIARDGLVEVDGREHVQDCERVRLAARGSRRRGDCTCGSDPS